VTIPSILAPVFVQVLLTIVLAVVMATRRLAAVKAGAVRRGDVSMGERAWPAEAQMASNAFSNQFELPLLFYVAVILAILTRKADLLFVALSWVFVATRIVHAAAYAMGNVVPRRFAAYLVGAAVLTIIWAVLALRVLLAASPA